MSAALSRRLAYKLAAVAAILAAAAVLWLRRTPDSAPPGPGESPASRLVSRLSWLSGCWAYEGEGFSRQEQWMQPRGGTMIGMSRTVSGGRTVEYEYLRIEPRGGRLAYVALPSGQAEATFLQAELTDTTVVFEDAAHDFPQRIVYERQPGGAIAAWIEGEIDGETRVIEFPLIPERCP